MKKTILVLLVLIFMVCPIKGQDKINPDGYIRGLSFNFEMGYDWSRGNRSRLVLSGYAESYAIFLHPELSAKTDNLFLRLVILHPTSKHFTIYSNIYRSWYWEEDEGGGFIPNPDKTYYNKFSVSTGFKLYIK